MGVSVDQHHNKFRVSSFGRSSPIPIPAKNEGYTANLDQSSFPKGCIRPNDREDRGQKQIE